ncbi:MAG TPA: SPFH domain-containing protein, partial [Anaerolineales bacterium]|nr:SPFH domain-containing protein [Anaerolineales bacterium]
MNTKFSKLMNTKKKDDQHIPPIAGFVFGIILIGSIKVALILDANHASDLITAAVMLAMIGIASYFLFAIKVASQWEKAVVLRLGKFNGLKGPGLFWLIPIIDTAVMWIDHRVTVTSFSAEKTLTKDTVPVDVDAVLFWVVWDAEKAA